MRFYIDHKHTVGSKYDLVIRKVQKKLVEHTQKHGRSSANQSLVFLKFLLTKIH